MFDDEYEEISEFWPENFHEVVFLIGEVNAYVLTLLIPGINLSIPKINPEQSVSPAWNCLPKFLQDALFHNLAGDRIYIPSLSKAKEIALLFAIDELGSREMTIQQIALSLGVMEETVYLFRRKRKKLLSRITGKKKALSAPVPNALPAPAVAQRALPAPMWLDDTP